MQLGVGSIILDQMYFTFALLSKAAFEVVGFPSVYVVHGFVATVTFCAIGYSKRPYSVYSVHTCVMTTNVMRFKSALAAITYVVVEWLCRTFLRLFALAHEVYDNQPLLKRTVDERHSLQDLQKIPRRVGFVLTESVTSTCGVARAILSCTWCGAEELDVYCGDGKACYDFHELAVELQRQGAVASISEEGSIFVSLRPRML